MKLAEKGKSVVTQGGLLILITIVIALLINWSSPQGIPWITPSRKIAIANDTIKVPLFLSRQELDSSTQLLSDIEYHPPQEINRRQAFEFFARGSALFIDARSREQYASGHIPGAISFPLEEIDASQLSLENLSSGRRIVTYCENRGCGLSVDLAVLLSELGFTEVYFFPGGWEAWRAADYQKIKGSKP